MSFEELLQRNTAFAKVWGEYESFTNEQYCAILERSNSLLIELVDSLHKDNIQLPAWKIWIEPVLFKFCYHVSSITKLFRGTEMPYYGSNKNLMIFDEPSVFVLFRAALENFLSFYYLFIDETAEEEKKEFRLLVWKYCGAKQRVEFVIDTEAAKLKQMQEVEVVENLQKEIRQSPFFLAYKKNIQTVILEGKKPRLFESWKSLIDRSSLRRDIFQNMYGYKSNYSHTEFISALQIKDGKYGHHPDNTRAHYLMLLLNGLISKAIIQLKNHFPSVKNHFESKDPITQFEIIHLYNVVTQHD